MPSSFSETSSSSSGNVEKPGGTRPSSEKKKVERLGRTGPSPSTSRDFVRAERDERYGPKRQRESSSLSSARTMETQPAPEPKRPSEKPVQKRGRTEKDSGT